MTTHRNKDRRAYSLFVLFVDLKKAYNSVLRRALWSGLLPTMLCVIRSFQKGMTAIVMSSGRVTDSFEVQNGLRQRCTLAPSLFNIIFCCCGFSLEVLLSSLGASAIQVWKNVG